MANPIDKKDVAKLTERSAQPPWRNRLARSAVNRKVGGSSPPGGVKYF